MTSADRVIDLGTGDGRILIAAARDRGAHGLGVDIDPVLVREARAAARRAGVADRVEFRTQDLFETPLGDADVITMFLLPDINLRLRPRLLALRPGTRIVSHAFDMGEWRPDRSARAGGAHVHFWMVPARVEGQWRIAFADGRRAVLELSQDFQRLAGTIRGANFGGPISRAGVAGDRIRFTADLGHGPADYRGKISDGEMEGKGWRAARVG